MDKHQFNVFADYYQFLLMDARADWSDLWTRWTPEALDHRYVEGEGFVGIATARNSVVPVEVNVADGPTDFAPISTAEGFVRSSAIDLPTGDVVVTGINEEGLGGRFSVPSGRYQVRLEFPNFDSVTEDGVAGEDRYVVTMWLDNALL